ncbi:hypothetical protein CYMTET_12260, partial [Cymbomonas tetramitiformis]
MDSYPEELKTPPLALVALLGRPDLHNPIKDFLLNEQRPPICSIGAAELSSTINIFGEPKVHTERKIVEVAGILKSGWLAKHRQRCPAVAVAFFDRESLLGDPTSWQTSCQQLDTIRSSMRARNTKLVIVVVQPNNHWEIPEERASVLRRRADVEARCLITYSSADSLMSIRRLGKLLHELAVTFYREEGRRIKARLHQRSGLSQELSVRYCFKIAVYAEFRQDWAAALKYYHAAYAHLQELMASPEGTSTAQRIAELLAVSEQVHLKLCTLMLHSSSLPEAVQQCRKHMRLFKRLPAVWPQAAIATHSAWIARQYRTFAELLENRPVQPSGNGAALREQQPGFYYHAAAMATIERRISYDQAVASLDSKADLPETVSVGAYVGQLLVGGRPSSWQLLGRFSLAVAAPREVGPRSPWQLLVGGSTPSGFRRLLDEEWVRHVVAEETSAGHVRLAIELLTKAHTHYKQSSSSCQRLFSFILTQIAGEYAHALDYTNARRLFVSVAAEYRREGWEDLLTTVLHSLRECARRLGLHRDHAEHSLELAALRRTGDHQQRCALFTSALAVLTEPNTEQLEYVINDTSALRTVLSCAVCFHQAWTKMGEEVEVSVALQARVPLPLPVCAVEVKFTDPRCTYHTNNAESSEEGAPESPKPALLLQPNQWAYLSFKVTPAEAGTLECIAITAHVGPNAWFKWDLAKPPPAAGSASPAPAAGAVTTVSRPPPRTPPLASLAPSPCDRAVFAGLRQSSPGTHPSRMLTVEVALPQPALKLVCQGPALVGEFFPVRVEVTSEGPPMDGALLRLKLSQPGSAKDPEVLPVPVETFRLGDDAQYVMCTGEMTVPTMAAPASSNYSVTFYLRFGAPVDTHLSAVLTWGTTQAAEPPAPAAGAAPEATAVPEDVPVIHIKESVPLKCQTPLVMQHSYSNGFREQSLLAIGGKGAASPGPASKPTALPAGDHCMLSVTVQATAAVPVRLQPLRLELDDASHCELRWTSAACSGAGDGEGGEASMLLLPGAAVTEMFELLPTTPLLQAVPQGSVHLRWRRSRQHPLEEPAPSPPGRLESGPADEAIDLSEAEAASAVAEDCRAEESVGASSAAVEEQPQHLRADATERVEEEAEPAKDLQEAAEDPAVEEKDEAEEEPAAEKDVARRRMRWEEKDEAEEKDAAEEKDEVEEKDAAVEKDEAEGTKAEEAEAEEALAEQEAEAVVEGAE